MKQNTSIKNSAYAFLVGSAIFFGACNNSNRTESDPKELAEESNEAKFNTRESEKNASFVVDAVASNNAEVSLAQLAQQRSTNQQVKQLAQKLETEHAAMAQSLRTIADNNAISVPDGLADDARKDYNDMNEKKVEDFDKAWLKEMKDKHEKTIRKYTDALDSVTDPSIRQWIEEALPKVRMHLDEVTKLHDSLK